MNRILALQIIEPIGMDRVGEVQGAENPSTCSANACSTCSSYSQTACSPAGLMVAAY
jgi:hypothetical protein